MPPEIDLYCERTTVDILDEPFGLVTNLAFLVAAALLARSRTQSPTSYLLIAWLAAIGMSASSLFVITNALRLNRIS